jgi:hypothetical protein
VVTGALSLLMRVCFSALVDLSTAGKDKPLHNHFLVGGLEHFLFFHNIWDNPSH